MSARTVKAPALLPYLLEMQIVRATIDQLADAQLLLNEYYEAVAVQVRDSPEEIRAYLTDPASSLWIAYV